MKKVNKILMATVAILLSLVLITTSIVSGVFAKFAIAKATDTTMTLQNFGATVTADKSSKISVTTANNKYYGDSHEYKATADIYPGSEYMDAFNFTVTAKPKAISTDVYLKIKVELEYVYANFAITNDGTNDFDMIAEGSTVYFLPLGFSFGSADVKNYVLGPWICETNADNVQPAKVSERVAEAIKNTFDASENVSCTGNVVSVRVNKGTSNSNKTFYLDGDGTPRNKFYFGFGVPLNYSDDTYTQDDFDVISTYLCSADKQIRVIYTIWFEQAID